MRLSPCYIQFQQFVQTKWSVPHTGPIRRSSHFRININMYICRNLMWSDGCEYPRTNHYITFYNISPALKRNMFVLPPAENDMNVSVLECDRIITILAEHRHYNGSHYEFSVSINSFISVASRVCVCEMSIWNSSVKLRSNVIANDEQPHAQ